MIGQPLFFQESVGVVCVVHGGEEAVASRQVTCRDELAKFRKYLILASSAELRLKKGVIWCHCCPLYSCQRL